MVVTPPPFRAVAPGASVVTLASAVVPPTAPPNAVLPARQTVEAGARA
jgi:hypothetical protein